VASFVATPRTARSVAYDLAELLAVAERSSPYEIVLFGTPSSEKHLASGFFRETAAGRGRDYVWAGGTAEFSFTPSSTADRTAIVDLSPYTGLAVQAADVLLNGHPVGRLGLREGRQRVALRLPASAQKAGENRLRFVFAATRSPADVQRGSDDRRQLAAAFHSIVLGPASDAALDDLLRREAPVPYGIVPGAPPVLLQAGPSTLLYAVRLPKEAELRFAPSLDPAARAAAARVRLAVTVEREGRAVREVWSGEIGPGAPDPGEIVVRLGDGEGSLANIGLHVEGERFAWVRWTGPRLLGRGARGLLDGPAPTADDRRTAERVRGRLGKPNVMLVVFDAGRADRFSAYGHGKPTTPEVDRIAREGVLFENATTPAVYTLGAMSSVWTSQYPDRHHSEVSFSARLPAGRLTLAELLTSSGVRTAGFVANVVAGRALGFERGFEHFDEVHAKHGSEADAFMEEVPAWLRANGAQRFFLYVHFREPHYPYDPPADLAERFGGAQGPITPDLRRRDDWILDLSQGRRKPKPGEIEQLRGLFDGNLAYADRELGRLRRVMEELGVWENTVVIVAADHGEELYEHGWIGHNVYVYQPSIHVPLIVRLPRGAVKPARTAELADLLDVAPTIADVFGVLGQGGSDREFQGQSLLPVLEGTGAGKPALLSRTVWDRPRYSLRAARYKLIHDTRTGEVALFDLARDPSEMNDLAAQKPLRRAYMLQELQDWIRRSGQGTTQAGAPGAKPTPEQCEVFKAMGYIVEGC
jgi:arylsulfatase A-like enzyme